MECLLFSFEWLRRSLEGSIGSYIRKAWQVSEKASDDTCTKRHVRDQCQKAFKELLISEHHFTDRYAGDYIWGAQIWFSSASDEANASERLRCETLKAKPPLEEFVRHPEIYVTPRKEIQWCARLRPW